MPQVLKARHNDYRITIYPQQSPNYWGHPVVWKLLVHTGFFHCRFWVKSRKRDPYSLIYAYFAAVSRNSSLDDLAQMRGEKIFHTTYGNGMAPERNVQPAY